MSKGFAPAFVIVLAAATLVAVHASAQFAPPGQAAKDGNRKAACGCYVCGTPLTVSFGEPDCAGILAEDACGGTLGGLPQEKRAGFCQKLAAQFGTASFQSACRAYAQYCGPETTAAQSPGGTSSPGQPGKSPGGQGPTAQKEPPPTPGKGAPDATKGKEVPMVAGSPGQTMVGGVLGKPPSSGVAQSASPSSTAQAASPSSTAQAVPLALASLRVDPQAVIGGKTVQGTVGLAHAPGANGLTVMLESNHPQLASVPASVTIASGTASAETGSSFKATFRIETKAVNQDQAITIKARAGVQTLQDTFQIRMPAVNYVSLNAPGKCDGENKATVKYGLIGPAPSGFKVRVHAFLRYPSGTPSQGSDESETVPAGDSAGSMRIWLPTCLATPTQRCDIHLLVRAEGQQGAVSNFFGSCGPP